MTKLMTVRQQRRKEKRRRIRGEGQGKENEEREGLTEEVGGGEEGQGRYLSGRRDGDA